MPSPSNLDIDELLEPVPGASPAGGAVPFEVWRKLEELRKEVNPDDFEANDPMRPERAQKADWPVASRVARETLATSSKDLRVAARLAESLTREHGYGGLRDGLRLLRRLVAECWDRLQPAVESEEDLEIRAAPFYWLDEADRGARFPNSLRLIPMLWGDGRPYSWYDWKQSQSGKGGIAAADIEKAVLATPREHCQTMFDDLADARNELEGLSQELNSRLGTYAPALTGLRQVVGDCLALARLILERKGPDPSPVSSTEDGAVPAGGVSEGGVPVGGGGSFVLRQVASRAQVYHQLAEAAAMLKQLEPHSPIPYLINRAVELGTLPFPDLMKALIRDAEVLAGMNRELGIKEPET